MSTDIQRIVLTPGEPAGIGPDLCIQLAQQSLPMEIIAACDPVLLEERAKKLGLELSLQDYKPASEPTFHQPGSLKVLHVACKKKTVCGQLDVSNVPYVLETLRVAAQACLDHDVAAMVTGPVHKGIINEAGIAFSGHTEFLAELTGATPVMMLATEGLRVALVTTHLPLRQVFERITGAQIEQVVRITHDGLRKYFAIDRPRLLVCGLNPHAGEGGALGREEIEIIEPLLGKLRDQGMLLHGPVPADTAFIDKNLRSSDVIVAMYHDQGLPVLKHMGFGNAVNITLGLPFIRTSVDHGTALELAGTGRADAGSLKAALTTAIEMVHNSCVITERLKSAWM